MNGYFVLRFYKDGLWRHIVIDDYLPIYYGSALIFGQCSNPLGIPL